MESSIHFCSILHHHCTMSYPFSSFSLFFFFQSQSLMDTGHMINAFYPFHRYHWFQSRSMIFRIFFTVLTVYLNFSLIFFMTYSITLWPFLDTFLFFRATPFLSTCRCILAIPCLPQFFRTFQLIISRKNLRVFRI